MLLVYENRTDGIVVEWKKTVHFPPHLHEAIEVVYVTDGDIELGVGQNCITWMRVILQSCFQT
mgnify:CR=1 FL=1